MSRRSDRWAAARRLLAVVALVLALVGVSGPVRAAPPEPDPDLVGPVALPDPGERGGAGPGSPAARYAGPGSPAARVAGAGLDAGGVALTGRGHGHGRGMSQYGAKGAAERGATYRRIISFYYPGTQWARARGRMQVLLGADTTPDVVVVDRPRLRVRARGGSWKPLRAAAATRWRLTPTAGGGTAVDYLDARGSWTRERRFRREAELAARGGPVRLVTPAGSTAYRGTLRSVVPPPGSSDGPGDRDTVNLVSLENYLRGVVPLEMPALWAPHAVRAQAVAARSYAAWERAHPRNTHYQVCDTSACQVYGGADAEHPAGDAAVRATRREVRYRDGRPAFTQFSASNGGWTTNGPFPYLRAQRDRRERGAQNPYARWQRTISRSSIERWAPAIGSLRAVSLTGRDGNGAWDGRVGTVVLRGSRATVRVSGETFRFAFALPSTWFTRR